MDEPDSGIELRPDRWAKAIQDAMPALIPLGIVGVWRWTMFLFRVIGWQLYRAQPPTALDKFKTEDVTLIIPTIDTDEEAMHEAMRSWVLNEPYEILIITVGEHLQKELEHIAATSLAADITRVLYVEKPANKRIQLVHGMRACHTDLMCFTDDDAIWNANFLKWLLVPFNDDKMGGTGSSQIMRPNDLTKPPTMYERIADMRLSGRMLEACASTFYDGSVSCLSGRTALYHKRIINDNFPQEFTGELWLNKYPLISGDDKFMTRWIVKHHWKMHMQVTPECTLATTFKADGKFFMQILRWTRNTWRSDCKSLVIERDIWYRYPVQAVLMVDRMISPFTLTLGPCLFIYALVKSKVESWTDIVTTVCIFLMWLLFSRTLRMLPHFYRCPEDISYLIYFIGYQYYFAFLKLYALFTLHVTSWGTREGVAGGVKQDNKIDITDEAKDDQRIEMAKKKRKASNLYKKGNISLMRRIHGIRGADDQEMENRARAHLQEAEPTMFNAAGTDPGFNSQMQSHMYAGQFGPQQQTFMQPGYSEMGGYGTPSGFGVPNAVGSEFGGQPRSGAGSVMEGVGSS